MRFDLIPWPINCAVIVGAPAAATIAEYLQWINPLLQCFAFLIGIAWGLFQIWIAYKRKSWRQA